MCGHKIVSIICVIEQSPHERDGSANRHAAAVAFRAAAPPSRPCEQCCFGINLVRVMDVKIGAQSGVTVWNAQIRMDWIVEYQGDGLN